MKVGPSIVAGKFDSGSDEIDEHLEWGNASKRVIVEFPLAMLEDLDREARRLGIARQEVIKTLLDQALNTAKAVRSELDRRRPA